MSDQSASHLPASADEAGRLAELDALPDLNFDVVSVLAWKLWQRDNPGLTWSDENRRHYWAIAGAVFASAGRLVPATQTQSEDAADTTWFWRIVDAEGLADVPSDEEGALRLLCRRAALAATPTQSEDARETALAEITGELANRRKGEPGPVSLSTDELEAVEAALAATPTPPAPSRHAVEAMIDAAQVAFNRHALATTNDTRGCFRAAINAALASADTRQGDGAAMALVRKIAGYSTSQEMREALALEAAAYPDAASMQAHCPLSDFEGHYDGIVLAARAALTPSADQEGK